MDLMALPRIGVTSMTNVEKGKIYWARLDPIVGTEQSGRRPVLIVSPNSIQDNLERAIVLPLTSVRRDYPTYIEHMLNGKQSYLMLDQIRTLHISRFGNEIDVMSTVSFRKVLARLQELFS
jgi:mRNA interferase MazF